MFGVTILGNNSAVPAHDRHPTAQAVTIGGEVLLLDAGEGTQLQIKNYSVKRSKISRIFISHLHGDHYFGLIGLLSSMALINRTEDLHLYAPAPLEQLIELQFKISDSHLPYRLIFHPLETGGLLVKAKNYTVDCFKVVHKIPCFGFMIRENHAPRRLNPEKAREYDIPASFYERLQAGEDYERKDGTLIQNQLVTLPGKYNRSYGYCADTLFTDAFLPAIQGADLLYHEATYLDDYLTQAGERFHSTARQAAQVAKNGDVGKLLLGHFSSKYKALSLFEEQACSVFANTEISREGVTYLV